MTKRRRKKVNDDGLRRGRPAHVHIDGTGFSVSVKNHTYRFMVSNGHVRPRDTVNGNGDDRNYAKKLVMRYLDEATVPA